MAPSLKKLILFHVQSKLFGFNMVDEISIQKVAMRKKGPREKGGKRGRFYFSRILF
jgi:hypothetical protein